MIIKLIIFTEICYMYQVIFDFIDSKGFNMQYINNNMSKCHAVGLIIVYHGYVAYLALLSAVIKHDFLFVG